MVPVSPGPSHPSGLTMSRGGKIKAEYLSASKTEKAESRSRKANGKSSLADAPLHWSLAQAAMFVRLLP
ncbi:hypothetical protein RRG08_060234 [Elysia crispata]|uniref:Uncharacterized protein n=1 Tax=Elysia crispata TaxID=231223 RepID=A0AAE1DMY8_9GAST|nr:hypothetical protein RRG08_060234 [Elysia crispata]